MNANFYINQVREFIEAKCPMPGHWCNGDPIPVPGRRYHMRELLKPQGICEFYDRQRGCLHPDHPQNIKK